MISFGKRSCSCPISDSSCSHTALKMSRASLISRASLLEETLEWDSILSLEQTMGGCVGTMADWRHDASLLRRPTVIDLETISLA